MNAPMRMMIISAFALLITRSEKKMLFFFNILEVEVRDVKFHPTKKQMLTCADGKTLLVD